MSVRTAVLMQFIATIIFSLHYVVAKDLMHHMTPAALASIRGLIGGGAMFFFALWRADKTQLREHLKGRALIILPLAAVFGFFLNQLFFMTGLQMSTPTNAAIVSNLIPLVSTGMAMLVGLEVKSKMKLAGLVLGLLTIWAYFAFLGKFEVASHVKGNFFILMNVFAYSIAINLAKHSLGRFPPLFVTGVMLFGGGLLLSTVAFSDIAPAMSYMTSAPRPFMLLLFELIAVTGLAWGLNFASLKYLTVSQTFVVTYFQIPITALISFLAFSEIPSTAMLPLVALVFLSGYLVIKK